MNTAIKRSDCFYMESSAVNTNEKEVFDESISSPSQELDYADSASPHTVFFLGLKGL